MQPEADLGIVLIAGDHARAHAAFLFAAGAAALGRTVVMFATGPGVWALCTNWSALAGSDQDSTLRARGVAGFDELRDACRQLGVAMIACPSARIAADIADDALIEGTRNAGISSFLEATRTAQLLSF